MLKINPLDPSIFKDNIKHHIAAGGGLLTLPTDMIVALTVEAANELAQEAQEYDSFQDYWVNRPDF